MILISALRPFDSTFANARVPFGYAQGVDRLAIKLYGQARGYARAYGSKELFLSFVLRGAEAPLFHLLAKAG